MEHEVLTRTPRHCAFWAKKKPINTDRWLQTLLRQYLDETTKSRPEAGVVGGGGVSGASKIAREGSRPEPILPGRDYTPFASGIWVFGHVANKVAETGQSPAFGQPQAVIDQVCDWWIRDRSEAAVKAHHIIASFHPRIAAELHRRRYPVDAMLLASVHQTLSQYAARFYPGETLGWVAGCHHDSGVPHAHVLLHPETASGKLLRMSGNKDGEQGDDRFEFLRATFNTRARQLYVALTQEPKNSELAERLSVSQFMVLAFHAWNTVLPNSLDASAAAVPLLNEWTQSRDFPHILREAAEAAEAALYTDEVKVVDVASFRASWTGVQGSLDTARASSFEAGLEAIRVVADGRASTDAYRPITSPHAAPAVPLEADYYALAGKPTGKHITSLEAAFLARRKESDRHRSRFNTALKAYKAAMLKSHEVLDQTQLRAANGALRCITTVCAVTGAAPVHLDVGISPGKPTPRAVPSPQRVTEHAERELATIASIEAGAHQPENPNAVPSILASAHAPTLRPPSSPASPPAQHLPPFL